MSGPLIWIVFPALVAVGLYAFRHWQRAVTIVAIGVAVLLALMAWQVPIGEPVPLGPLPDIRIGSTLTVLGRRFVLDNDTRPILGLIYLGVALWFGGSYVARTPLLFIPLALGVAALLTASLAVRPFLYAALLIQIAAMLCVPILSPPGRRVGRGAIRFLTFQTLGMPFILFTGWMLTGVEANPGNADLGLRVIVLLGLGFTMLMSVFPFNTWIPMSAEDAHPYAAAFVFFVLPGVIALFSLGLVQSYAWLRSSETLYSAMRLLGALMVVTGGLWALFQNHLGRILGYAVTVEIGQALLALSLGDPALNSLGASALAPETGTAPLLGLFFAQFLPRGIGLAVWALALAVIQERIPQIPFSELRFRRVQGLAHSMPVTAASLVLANLSMAGFPMLAAFPVRTALWSALAQTTPAVALLSLFGNIGLLAAGLRTLAVLVTSRPAPGENAAEGWTINETAPQVVLLSLGWIMLFVIGLAPQWFLPALVQIAQMF